MEQLIIAKIKKLKKLSVEWAHNNLHSTQHKMTYIIGSGEGAQFVNCVASEYIAFRNRASRKR